MNKSGVRRSGIYVLLSVLITHIACAHTPTEDCAGLNKMRISGVSAIEAQFIEAGALKFSDGNAAPGLPALCRVRATAAPTADSHILFEVWLPASGWNGRLWGIGNGWFAGGISEEALAGRVSAGYAAVATDTGHQAAPMDTTWALGHRERIVDFGHRAIHVVSVDAKRIAAAFFGRAPAHSYFSSCSNGGREALMEAQRYPADYDGIIAGAAAADWTHLYLGAAVVHTQWLAAGPGYLPATKLAAIHGAVLAACDKLDGVEDGVIEDPRRCGFDPSVLACSGTETDQCLTSEQVETLRKLFRGPALPSGTPLTPGVVPGTELGWQDVLLGSGAGKNAVYPAVAGFFKNMVFDNAQWDPQSFDAASAAPLTDRKLASVLNATDANLKPFISRGGRLILYHGWSDPLVPALSSVEYYSRVVNAVGESDAERGVRLFMAPGMGHCGGGPGPNEFGQWDAGDGDPSSSLGAALQRWVEQSVAPDQIIAARHRREDDPPGTAALRTRPLCAFPLIGRYRGQGDTDQAQNFACGAPPH